MPDPTVNKQIALLRGWKPCNGMLGEWLPPDGSGVSQPVPLYDTDWNATGELLAEAQRIEINQGLVLPEEDRYEATVWMLIEDRHGEATTATLPAAIAAAYLAAREGEEVGGG